MPHRSTTNAPPRQIRPLTAEDLDAVVDLSLLAWEPVFVSWQGILGTSIFNLLYRPSWREAQARQVRENCLAVGAESFVLITPSDEVVGFLVLEREGEDGRVQMIAVHPAHHRRGHARALMEFAVTRLSEQGTLLINVGTGADPAHAPARALYEALGFTGVPLMAYYKTRE
jgi:ribosomal protein S18 acetylase RimI-like enzyme